MLGHQESMACMKIVDGGGCSGFLVSGTRKVVEVFN
jgi:hypothetical protein